MCCLRIRSSSWCPASICRLPATDLERWIRDYVQSLSWIWKSVALNSCLSNPHHPCIHWPLAGACSSLGPQYWACGFSMFLISQLNFLCSAFWGQDCLPAFATWWVCFSMWFHSSLQGWRWLDVFPVPFISWRHEALVLMFFLRILHLGGVDSLP